MRRIRIAEAAFPISEKATEGKTLVVQGWRNEIGRYESYGIDLYWTKVPY